MLRRLEMTFHRSSLTTLHRVCRAFSHASVRTFSTTTVSKTGPATQSSSPSDGVPEASPSRPRQTDLSGLGPSRFYTDVSVAPSSSEPRSHRAYNVTLDRRRLRTPQNSILAPPTEALALAVACEWDAQTGRIRPSSMPMTTLVSTAQDVIPDLRDVIVPKVMSYLATDALCIRPDKPTGLVSSQREILEPIQEHLREKRGLEFNVTLGGLVAEQRESVVQYVREFVSGLDDYSLAAMDSAVSTCRSVAIAMALYDRALDVDGAVAAARSEEAWQEGVWGTVEGGHDLDAADIRVRLAASDLMFRLIALDPTAFLPVANRGSG